MALQRIAAPGVGFRGGTLFGPKIGEDQEIGLRGKISRFSVQKYVKSKKKGHRCKIGGFSVQMRMGTNHSEKRKAFTTNRWSYGFTS